MQIFDIFIYIMIGIFGVMMIFLFYAKKRMDNNEPIFGSQRKQFLEEQGGPQDPSAKKDKRKKNRKENNRESLKDLIGIKDIRYGIFEKERNEYCLIIATDSVNFDLLNETARSSIIMGYQSLFRVVRFPVQLLGQAVRQDLRKDEQRFMKNLEKCNPQTRDYCMRVISHIKERSEKEFRIARKAYYVVTYIYQSSRIAQLTPEQKEKKIVQELYMRARTVVQMLKRARIESEILDSLSAMEVMKRALNRDRMLSNPIEGVVEPGREKLSAYVSADVTTLPGYEDLINVSVEEVRGIVQETEREFKEEKIS
ncbi:hypothetical protein [Ammoniphilus resinae]|uniref:Uncharacterized protein n=1 Tax=Ammoniphilus resinae TaxID=861532 RepID=A0ABS4GP60_9BACL|nr:hypothetical protein [Ammoniphilus resinae]MBP1932031.1 hypothetical protein [Ammoniphilus resinae]